MTLSQPLRLIDSAAGNGLPMVLFFRRSDTRYSRLSSWSPSHTKDVLQASDHD